MLSTIFENGMTMQSLLVSLVAALALGILTAAVFLYKDNHSASFAMALALLPMAIALVIMLVNGNIGTGVAVAGAFALVRFRSVPGTAREIAAIFVDVALGLALGMGYIGIAILFFVIAALATLLLTAVHFGGRPVSEKQVRITVPENLNYEGLFDDIFRKYTQSHELKKVRTTNMGTLFELTYVVMFKEEEVPKGFLDAVRTRNGNLSVVVSEVEERETL